jgi:hypothetical protein
MEATKPGGIFRDRFNSYRTSRYVPITTDYYQLLLLRNCSTEMPFRQRPFRYTLYTPLPVTAAHPSKLQISVTLSIENVNGRDE